MRETTGSAATEAPVREDALSSSMPGRLLLRAKQHPHRIALLQKDLGIYVAYTWAEYAEEVAAVAQALRGSGVGAGDVVAILSDNRVEWVFADLAAQAIGAIAVGVYPTNSTDEVRYVLSHSRARLVIAEDQEQVDKILRVRDELPELGGVVVIDPRGTRGYPQDLVHWSDFVPGGTERPSDLSARLERWVGELRPGDPAVLIYTSGTTSLPKGALWSHAVMTAQADRFHTTAGMTGDDTVLSYLPLCHGAEKVLTELVPLTAGCRVHFGESISTVQADLTEIGPTMFVGMPRIWEKIRASVEQGLRRGGPLKRLAYRRCLAVGRRLVERHAAGRATVADRLARRVIDVVAFRALREHIGLARAWFVMSGGAPIGPDLLYWLHAIGIPVIESYGLTEAGVTHMGEVGGPPRIGTVGTPMPGAECRLAEDGEILLRGDTNFLGYLHDREATRETVTDDGWVRTGDLGEIDDDGLLRIVGRKKDIIITAGGKNLSPTAIENTLKSSPYIAQAVPVGDGKPFVSALIQIDWETVSDWASVQRLPHTSFGDLSAKPEVVRLVQEEVDRANEQLARVSQVRAFRLLPKQLHQDDGELTATQKVRRRAVLEQFGDLVDDMYRRR